MVVPPSCLLEASHEIGVEPVDAGKFVVVVNAGRFGDLGRKERHRLRHVRRDPLDLIRHCRVPQRHDEPGANAVNSVRPRRAAREHRRLRGLDGDDPQPGVVTAQHLRRALQRA